MTLKDLGPLKNTPKPDLSFITTVGGGPSSAVDIQNVALGLIDESDRLRLREKPYPGLEDLAASLASAGQSTPLFVRPAGDRYELVSGYRRRAALEMLGAPSALVRIYHGLDDAAAYDLAISENADRDALTDWERAVACLRLRDAGRTADEIARQFGWGNRRQAEIHVALARDSSPSLRAALQRRVIGLSLAVILLPAFRDTAAYPESRQNEILTWVEESKPTVQALRQKLRPPAAHRTAERPIFRERKNGRIDFSGTIDPSKPEEFDAIADELRRVLRKITRLKSKTEQ